MALKWLLLLLEKNKKIVIFLPLIRCNYYAQFNIRIMSINFYCIYYIWNEKEQIEWIFVQISIHSVITYDLL